MISDPEAHRLGLHSRRVQINRLDFHLVEAGAGLPLLFLHGFPEYWGSWQDVILALKAQFRCVAPDLRGYGLTERPPHLRDYSTAHLIEDGRQLLDHIGQGPCMLVTHDWGATLGFYLAMKMPEKVAGLVVLNGAHPYILQDHIWDNPNQRLASQYMRRLTSKTGEHELCAENAEQIAQTWLGEARQAGKITPSQYQRFVALWSDQAGWDAMLNWYRAANFDIPPLDGRPPRDRWTDGLNYAVDCPVSVIWGNADEVFSIEMLEDLKRHVRQLDITELGMGAGHVPHRDEPARCAEVIARSAVSAFDLLY